MLIFNFKRIFGARAIEKPTKFLKDNGYNVNRAARIANSRMYSLNLADIERLCVLLKCTPNDIIEWIPDEKEEIPENHPLISLRRDPRAGNLIKMISSIPLDKLGEIEKLINQNLNPPKV